MWHSDHPCMVGITSLTQIRYRCHRVPSSHPHEYCTLQNPRRDEKKTNSTDDADSHFSHLFLSPDKTDQLIRKRLFFIH